MGKKVVTKEEILNNISQNLENYVSIPCEMIKLETEIDEIGLDSLDMCELAMDLEVDYNIDIRDSEIEEVKTISDLIDIVYNKVDKK